MSTRHRNFGKGAGLTVLLLVGGCGAFGGAITTAPNDWAAYSGKTVTVRGNAGNLRQGPIVRFDGGGYAALQLREPWSVDVVGRPVEVTGRVISGQNFRTEAWVIDVTSIKPLPQSAPAPVEPADPKAAAS